MRHMPTNIHGPRDEAIEVPSVPVTEWHELVQRMIGRPISKEEDHRLAKMAAHNWTARVAAEAILGRDLTEAEVAKARHKEAKP